MASAFERIDFWMGSYYQKMGRNDYFDENGRGKFKAFVEDQDYDEEEVDEELKDDDCGYIDFIEDVDEFPFNDKDKSKDTATKTQIIRDKIVECYENKDEIIKSQREKPSIKIKQKQQKANTDAKENEFNVASSLKRMQTTTIEGKDDDESAIILACAALQRYYRSLNANQYHKNLQTYVEETGLDMQSCLDEGDESDIMNYDQDDEEKFPYPESLKNANRKIKQRFKFDIIKRCYEHPTIIFVDGEGNPLYPKCLLSSMTIKELYSITEEEFNAAQKLYEEQCPAIWFRGGLQSDLALIYLTAISVKYKFDYIQSLAQAYLREKIDKYDGKNLEVKHFCDAIVHLAQLRDVKFIPPWPIKEGDNSSNFGTAYEVVQHGLKTYGKRCVPYMVFRPPWAINDSVEIVTRYIHSMIKFIKRVLDESRSLKKATTPFQIDLVMSFTEPTTRGITYYIVLCCECYLDLFDIMMFIK